VDLGTVIAKSYLGIPKTADCVLVSGCTLATKVKFRETFMTQIKQTISFLGFISDSLIIQRRISRDFSVVAKS